jgi:hypothetical protein
VAARTTRTGAADQELVELAGDVALQAAGDLSLADALGGRVGVAGQGLGQAAGPGPIGHIPQQHCVVRAAGGEGASIGSKRHRADRFSMASERGEIWTGSESLQQA